MTETVKPSQGELKPCPFCGGSDPFVERADFSACYVICNDCGWTGFDGVACTKAEIRANASLVALAKTHLPALLATAERVKVLEGALLQIAGGKEAGQYVSLVQAREIARAALTVEGGEAL